jgi:hypothetical protein
MQSLHLLHAASIRAELCSLLMKQHSEFSKIFLAGDLHFCCHPMANTRLVQWLVVLDWCSGLYCWTVLQCPVGMIPLVVSLTRCTSVHIVGKQGSSAEPLTVCLPHTQPFCMSYQATATGVPCNASGITVANIMVVFLCCLVVWLCWLATHAIAVRPCV